MAGNVKCVIIHRFLLNSFSTGHFLALLGSAHSQASSAPASSKATHKTVITHKVLVLYLQHASPSRTQAESLLGPSFLERSKRGTWCFAPCYLVWCPALPSGSSTNPDPRIDGLRPSQARDGPLAGIRLTGRPRPPLVRSATGPRPGDFHPVFLSCVSIDSPRNISILALVVWDKVRSCAPSGGHQVAWDMGLFSQLGEFLFLSRLELS